MKVEGAIHRQFSQLYKGLEQQALGFRSYFQLCVIPGYICASAAGVDQSRAIRIPCCLFLQLMNQLDQLVADIDRRNLGVGFSGLFNCRRLRRFGGLVLGEQDAGEE